MGSSLFYTVRRIKGNYYLYKVEYDPETKGKKQISLGNCAAIEEILKSQGKIKSGARRLARLGRRPHTSISRTNPHAESYNPHPEIPDSELVAKFYNWCVSELGNTWGTCRDRANYLRRPLDPKNDHSVRAYRLFYRFMGWDPSQLPKTKPSNIDLRIPTESEIITSLGKACNYSSDYCVVYRLLIESGSRLKAVIHALRNYDPSKDEDLGSFYAYELGKFTKSKKTFYLFHITKLRPVSSLGYYHASKLARELHITRPKYIRKFVSTKMIEVGIPSDIVNFIQGRTPKDILNKHYLDLYALTKRYYPLYAEWLRGLRGVMHDG